MHFERNDMVPNQKWSQSQQFEFEFHVPDTFQKFNLFLNFRNTNDYPYANLYVFMDTKFENNKTFRDTFECYLADKKGVWYGHSAAGNIFENRVLFQRKFNFPDTGKVLVSFTHGMRDVYLEGVHDVGLRVEKSK